MSWQPQEEPLRHLGQYLNATLGADKQARDHATEMLQQAKRSPDITNYLCYLFLHPTPPPGSTIAPQNYLGVRSAASLMLKNLLKPTWPNTPPDGRNHIKESVLQGLSDPNEQIRRLTGNVITEIVRVGTILSWPDILMELIRLVEGTNSSGATVSAETQESAMSALGKICEDNRKSLDKDYNGQRPLNYLIPKLLEFTGSPIANVRGYSLASINLFIPAKSEAILANLDGLLDALFRLATDEFEQVRRSVCRAIVQIVDIRADKIAPHMQGIVDYMIKQQQTKPDTNEAQDVALEAAEFWLTVGENEQISKMLGPYLNRIIPTLLSSMIYSEEDMIRLGGEEDDADQEDKEEDLKPVFAKSKKRLPNGEAIEVTEATEGVIPEESELSDGELEEDDELFLAGLEDPEDKWNLRKCSAAALDVLASVYGHAVFEIILPYLKTNLFNQEWQYREAAVLALGAVADGCMDGVTPHLPELVPYLIGLLNDPEALVRQITCWTLGRYSRWAAQSIDPAMKTKFFEPMMEGILTRMLDNNKRVQEAAASAFANLEEQSRERLVPYIEPIVRQFVIAMGRYKDRNMYILYDCIQTLAEHVGAALARKDIVDVLIPALVNRWKKVKDENRELFPLLECFSFVAQALGHEFQPFAAPIFNRCIHIIHTNLEQAVKAATEPQVYDFPDKDFLVTSLDLMSAIIQALDNQSASLVANSRPPFFQILTICLQDPSNDVKQSGYALLGDCAIYVFRQLEPYLPNIMGLLIEQLDMGKTVDDGLEARYSVINNACWSCGEVALQQGAGMGPYIDKLFTRLLPIIQRSDIPNSVTENAAIALGRLGLGSCDDLAPHLEEFAWPFLDALGKVAETDEKDTAFRGFVMIVGRNPEAMESCLAHFFKSIARYKNASKDLEDLFRSVIVGYKGVIGDWGTFMGTMPAADQERLHAKYNI